MTRRCFLVVSAACCLITTGARAADPAPFASQTRAVQYVVRAIREQMASALHVIIQLARLSDGRFLVMLPHTPKEGGAVACERATLHQRANGTSASARGGAPRFMMSS